jgi:hypothetical protein
VNANVMELDNLGTKIKPVFRVHSGINPVTLR